MKSLSDTILVRGARQLLTLRGKAGPRRGSALEELEIIRDGSLLIRDGIILEVGPTRRIENLAAARGATEISVPGKTVMPGFVDSHTCLAFPTYMAEADRAHAVGAVRGLSGKRLRAQNRAHLAAMARHGTTTVEAGTGCGPETKAEMKLLRVLSSLDGDPIDLTSAFVFHAPPEDPAGALDWALRDLLPVIRRRHLAKFAGLLWDACQPAPEYYRRYLAGARELGFACRVHAAGPDPDTVPAALDHQAISIDCLGQVTECEASLLACSSTIATIIPATTLERDDWGTARRLVEAGAAIALATGYDLTRPGTLSMQTAVALAHLRMGLSFSQAVTASTINGAFALGCANRTGSLEPGKLADLLVLDTGDYRELGRHIGANMIHLTMKRGKAIYREPEVSPPAALEGLQARL